MNKMDYFNNLRQEMIEFVPSTVMKVLDVGCGEGLFGEQLIKMRQVEVWGVEPNENAARIASQKLFKIVNQFFDKNVILPQKYFDCIVFNDVLEHMVDPWEILQFSKDLLRDENSSIVASIPNFRYWHNLIEIVIEKKFEYKSSGILDKTHLRFFTESSIIKLFKDTGYDVVKIVGINPTPSKKFKLTNFLLMNKINDMQFLQFAVVAKLK